ncbi:MAG: glycine cleavage system protein GcvH [Anaerolineae bacterium]|nr:glycine cleavage system protein GcvH [Anaerolineae bacterium]
MVSRVDQSLRYTETHDWVRVEGDIATFGITEYAQDQLSDIVFVELPQIGDTFEQGQVYAVVESVKAASDCYTPVAGEVVEINEELESSPALVNQEPYDGGWFAKVRMSDPSQVESLRDAESYSDLLRQLTEEE